LQDSVSPLGDIVHSFFMRVSKKNWTESFVRSALMRQFPSSSSFDTYASPKKYLCFISYHLTMFSKQ
jgi:hypothetical protein